MNTAAQVDTQLTSWLQAGLIKPEIVKNLAEACLGWSYVYGAYGQYDTPSLRESYAKKYASSMPDEAKVMISKCQVLREKNPRESCSGCKWYPSGKTRCFDCRGFTRWVFSKVDVSIKGVGATSQWNDNSNWQEKGTISNLPLGSVGVLFQQNGSKMQHTGIHIGGGNIVHCSGEVKYDSITNKHWTHYAIPKGMEGVVPVDKPTIKKGSKGEYVTLAQNELISLGYDVGPKGADGIFGTATQQAVKQFQTDYNVKPVDGIIGRKTWDALDNAVVTEYYKVTIPHLPKPTAETLVQQYAGATMEKE